jgi:hypothetical protein
MPENGSSYYSKVLRCTSWQTELASGLQMSRQLSKRILFLQDNVAPNKADNLADLHSEVLKHPTYSPDLAPSDCCLFPNITKHLKGRKFSSTEEARVAVDGWFAAQPKQFSLGWITEDCTMKS